MPATQQPTPAASGATQPGATQRSASARPAPRKAASAPSAAPSPSSTASTDPLAAFKAQASARRRELADLDAQRQAIDEDNETLDIAAVLASQHIAEQQRSNAAKQRELDAQAARLRQQTGLPAPTAPAADTTPSQPPAPANGSDTQDDPAAPPPVPPNSEKLQQLLDDGVDPKYALPLTGYDEDSVRQLLNIPPGTQLTTDVLSGAFVAKFNTVDTRLDQLEAVVFADDNPQPPTGDPDVTQTAEQPAAGNPPPPMTKKAASAVSAVTGWVKSQRARNSTAAPATKHI